MIGIIKGDVRYTYLSQMLGDAVSSDSLKDFYNIDRLVLPLGGIRADYTIKQTELNLKDILNVNRINAIYTGNANKELTELCRERHIRLYEMLKDHAFVMENAELTAKGLIYYLHGGSRELSEYHILVLGYGNIGYYLCKLFKALGTEFGVYTENKLEEKYLRLEGYSKAEEINGQYDIIINTIPQNVKVNYPSLTGVRVVDVASPPYGFDIDEIMKYGISYEIVSAIPSKFAPASAARIIKKFLENHR